MTGRRRPTLAAVWFAVIVVCVAVGTYSRAKHANNGTQQAVDYLLGIPFNAALILQCWHSWRSDRDSEPSRAWAAISWVFGLVWCLFDYVWGATHHNPDWVDLLLAGLFAIFLFIGGRRNRDAAKRLIGAKSQALLDKLRTPKPAQDGAP